MALHNLLAILAVVSLIVLGPDTVCSASTPDDSLHVLQLLERARSPSSRFTFSYTHDSALSARALELAERIGWERGIAKAHLWLYLAWVERDFVGATGPEIVRHWSGITKGLPTADPEDIVIVNGVVAELYMSSPSLSNAGAHLRTAREAVRSCQNTSILAWMNYIEARFYRLQERWAEAFPLALAAVSGAQEAHDMGLVARSNRLLGMVRGRLGDLDAAEKNFQTSYRIADSLHLYSVQAGTQLNWAYCLQVKGRWAEALEHYRIVRRDAELDPIYTKAIPQIDMAIGHMLIRLDSVAAGNRILSELYRKKLMSKNPYEQEFNVAYALLMFKKKRYLDAVRFARTAFFTPQADENDVIKRDASSILLECYKALNRPAEALRWSELAHEWQDSVLYHEQSNIALRSEMERKQLERTLADSLAHAEDRHRIEMQGQEEVTRERDRRNILLFSVAAILVFCAALWQRLRHTARTKRIIEVEKRRSDQLLLNILPAEVAEELKENGSAQARDIDNVTILFTDFKGFTSLSEQMSAQELVEELNTCFKAFDTIVSSYGVEKIKTIGDAYMAAGGLPAPTSLSVLNTVKAALEMQRFMQTHMAQRAADGKHYFEMRVGIHTGPVVAGIVGVKKFQYDVWGDTVNTASRMESAGEVGRVNVSAVTYNILKGSPQLAFTSRGAISVKGKGELQMYFVDLVEPDTRSVTLPE